MSQDRYQRQIVEHTSPAWRLTAVALVFGGLFFFGWAARIFRLEEQFSMFFVITLFTAALFWAKKRPDRLKRRFGAFGKVALAIQESADDIRASVYSRSVYYGILFGMGYAVLVIVSKELVLVVVTSLYAWQIVAAIGCIVAAVVTAPQFFSAAAKRMSVSDEDYPEENREVESRKKSAEIEPIESMTMGHDGHIKTKNGEERPKNTGIGYYDEDGNPITPEEFEALVSNAREEDE